MFIWGTGAKALQLPAAYTGTCSRCGELRLHDVSVLYEYAHIFWVVKGLKHSVVSVRCSTCGTVSPVAEGDRRMLFGAMGGNPIPFFDRYGAHMLAALIVAWVLVALSFP